MSHLAPPKTPSRVVPSLAFRSGILHVVGFTGCPNFEHATSSATELEQAGALKGFRPIAHGSEQQFRAWLLNHPQGRRRFKEASHHTTSPLCWIEWPSGRVQYIGGVHELEEMEEVVSRPGSPFVPVSVPTSPVRSRPLSAMVRTTSTASLRSTQFPSAKAPTMEDKEVIGPDGKVERPDTRPPIMDLKESKLEEMPWQFHVMKCITHWMSSSGAESGKARLITIRYSHYCERARWVLSQSPLEFTEDGHPPGLQMFPVQEVCEGKRSATPVLVMPEGDVIADSAQIVRDLVKRFPSELGHLYPADITDEIRALESELEMTLGANARQLGYTYVLDRNFLPKAVPYLCSKTSKIESLIYRQVAARIAKPMIAMMRCRYSRLPQAEAELDELFEKLGRRLSGNRRYLCGNGKQFTAADLTFAALAYPILLPSEMSEFLPPLEELPEGFRNTINKYRNTVAGQHALRMYRDHRFREDAERVIVPPNANRDGGFVKIVVMAFLAVTTFIVLLSYLLGVLLGI